MRKLQFKKLFAIVLSVALMNTLFTSCGGTQAEKERVIIYSSSESFRNERFQGMLDDRFPDYEIVIESIPTGENVAKILAEGQDTECDILFDIEQSFMNKLLDKDILADVSGYDMSMYMDDFQPESKEYLSWSRFSACIALNADVLQQRNLEKPKTWEDLLNPAYKGLISMPNPKTSGTGYVYLKFLVNQMGEEKAYQYFDSLAQNVLQFTSSGAGPTNALLKGEVAIGLGMTYQVAAEIEKGADFEILFFDGGAPHSSTANAIIKKSADRKAVQEVMQFFYSDILDVDNIEFMPEHGLKVSKNENPHFPQVVYGDMGVNTTEEKDRLIEKWKY